LLGALQFLGPGNRDFYNPNYHNIAPRLGFSYQAIPKAVIHGGYGIFYPESVTSSGSGIRMVLPPTNFNRSLNGGVTPNPNVSTSNPWGGQYAQITGNARTAPINKTAMASAAYFPEPSIALCPTVDAGCAVCLHAERSTGRELHWQPRVRMVGSLELQPVESEVPVRRPMVTPNTSFLSANAAFQSLSGAAPEPGKKWNHRASTCNIDNSTAVTNEQLLLAYPQYCGVSQTDAPNGQSLYNSLQVTYNHRISKGLTALVSYTYSKFLDNVEGNNPGRTTERRTGAPRQTTST
jgi:hypothetical protein